MVAVGREDAARSRLVGDEVQRARAQHRHRLRQIQQPADLGVGQDGGRLPQVTQHHRDLVAGGEQRLAVGRHHGIVVYVDHAYPRHDPLGQLVHVGLGRKAAAEVEKLPDSALGGEIPDHPAEKRPVVARYCPDVRNRVQELPGRIPVGAEIVFPAEQVIINPGDIRRAGINADWRRVLVRHIRHHS